MSSPIPNVVSFHIETSAGGLPITLCACGALVYQPMAEFHVNDCATYQTIAAINEAKQ